MKAVFFILAIVLGVALAVETQEGSEREARRWGGYGGYGLGSYGGYGGYGLGRYGGFGGYGLGGYGGYGLGSYGGYGRHGGFGEIALDFIIKFTYSRAFYYVYGCDWLSLRILKLPSPSPASPLLHLLKSQPQHRVWMALPTPSHHPWQYRAP
ncbi:unnamed protein product [Orchesella dallaii]|uniref:Uncharacterized protein n=1 Tax=Orchesella dallaii TaxID=48710 RepID=A0ABP1S0L8_9HEXA